MQETKLSNILFVIGLLGVGSAMADSPVSKSPRSIRQIYDDSSFTEMVCIGEQARGRSDACKFIIGVGKKSNTYVFELEALGYRDSIATYGYFPEETGQFSVQFEVTCTKADLALHPGADELNATCWLTMGPKGGRLVPVSLEMFGQVRGKNFNESRIFGSQLR